MSYNLTAISENATGLLSLMQGVNEVLLFGYLGALMLLSLTVVFGTSFYFATQDIAQTVGATSAIMFLLASMLAAMGLLSALWVFVTLILWAAILAFNYVKR